jgi:CO/xanthine dehydrogenase FAD-binding subunit
VSIEEYYLPQSLEEVVSLLDGRAQGSLVMAGGTLAMPLINEGISTPEQVLGLQNAGLNYIKTQDGTLLLGAMTTLSEMIDQKIVPMLAEAAAAVGGWAIRNMATVGGNLFAPPPGGDFAAALLALDAELILLGKQGERSLPIKNFFTGFMANQLRSGEVLKEVQIKLPQGKTAYTKFGRRHANTPSIVTAAVYFEFEAKTVSSARIALNAVGPFPFRAMKAEKFLIGKSLDDEVIDEISKIAVSESDPFTDPIASKWYRRKMIPVVLARTLDKIEH